MPSSRSFFMNHQLCLIDTLGLLCYLSWSYKSCILLIPDNDSALPTFMKNSFFEMGQTTRRSYVLNVFIYLLLLSSSYMALPTQALAAVGDVNYISDVLSVPMRSGPSPGHRIIHRGLPSGTHLTILAIDEEATFTQVRTLKGLEGWVRTQYLIGQPIGRVKLKAAEKRLQKLQTKMETESEARTSIQAQYKETDANNQKLNAQLDAMTKELAELKRISADPINEHARNVELNQQNTRLVAEVDELASKARRLEENVQLQWLLYGGALVLIGLIFGLILKKRPQTQASYSRYS